MKVALFKINNIIRTFNMKKILHIFLFFTVLYSPWTGSALHAEESENSFFSLNEDELNLEKKQLDLLELTVETNLAFRFFHNKIPFYLKQFETKDLTETAEYKYFRALDYYNKNSKSEALLYAVKSAEIDKSYSPSLNLIGVLYTDAGRISEATDYFKRSVKESPWDPTFNYNYANNLYQMNKSEEALHYADTSIQLKSNVKDAAYLKGLILIELNRKKEASFAFDLARLNGLNTEDFIKKYMRVALDTADEIKSLELLTQIESYNDIDSKRMAVAVRMKMGEYAKVKNLLLPFIFTDKANLKDKENYVIAVFKMKGDFQELDRLTADETEKIHLAKLVDTLKNNINPSMPEIRDPILNPIN